MSNINVLKKILETHYSLSNIELSESMLLKDDLGFDSLTLVSLVLSLEDELGITFDISLLDPSNINTVGDLLKLID